MVCESRVEVLPWVLQAVTRFGHVGFDISA